MGLHVTGILDSTWAKWQNSWEFCSLPSGLQSVHVALGQCLTSLSFPFLSVNKEPYSPIECSAGINGNSVPSTQTGCMGLGCGMWVNWNSEWRYV